MDFLDTEYVRTLISTQAQVSLTEKLLVVGAVWAVMGRKVSSKFTELKNETQAGINATSTMFQNHLKAIEEKFERGIEEMKAMKETLSKDLKVNSERLKNLEDGFQNVTKRVERLENKGI